MERYSGTQAMEGVPADPAAEWPVPAGETGLEVPMWRLGLGGGGGRESYPERPGEPDCIYYVRTGFCGYGDRCRFNHPRDRSAMMGSLRAGGGEHPERAGQPICQYYMRTGMCKFGTSCKYHHPKQVGPSAALALNVYGYPLRPGEKECTYYVKTGQCKFGVTCKFHHPQPAGIPDMPAHAPGMGPTPSVYPTLQSPVQSSQQIGAIPPDWPLPRPPMLPGSYLPGSYAPFLLPPGVLPVPGWPPYQAPVSPIASPTTQTTVGAGHVTAYTGPYLSGTSPGPTSSIQKERAFPERPGEPECQYYIRTGNCKFGATCKYHHPPGRAALKSNFTLSPMGLPLRPGGPICGHYAQHGVCKFGPSCKYDHPIGTFGYSPSADSVSNPQVTPHPVDSTNATLAPLTSSSDLRPELLSGLQMSYLNNTSASVGSMFSTGGGAIPQSNPHLSGQGTICSSIGCGMSHEGLEVHPPI